MIKFIRSEEIFDLLRSRNYIDYLKSYDLKLPFKHELQSYTRNIDFLDNELALNHIKR